MNSLVGFFKSGHAFFKIEIALDCLGVILKMSGFGGKYQDRVFLEGKICRIKGPLGFFRGVMGQELSSLLRGLY